MSLEKLVQDLIDALKETTAALNAASEEVDASAAPVKKAAPKKGNKQEEADEEEEDADEANEADEEESDDTDEAEEADEEDDKSEEVLALAKKAITKNKAEVTKILAKLKVKKVSELPAAKHDLAIKLLKAVK